MSNFFQKSVASFLLVAGVSISYYFVIVLPKNIQLENERKCQETGRVLHKADAQDPTAAQLEGKFKFDTRSEQCLYMGGFVYKNGVVQKYIKNVYTNETIAEFMTNVDDPSFRFGDREKFGEVEEKYFSE